MVKEIFKEKKDDKDIIAKIHKEFLKEYSKNVKVWIVNGELVRSLFFLDQQVHIQNGIVKEDQNFSKIYDSAHRSASRLEYFCRHHLEKLDEKLTAEINKS